MVRVHAKAALRLFGKHIARLITIVAIVAVSVGFMSGIGEVENKIDIAIERYYKDYNLSDLYVKSKSAYGFSADERAALEERFGEDNVEYGLCYETEEDGDIVRVYALDMENNAVDALELLEGRLPESDDEIVAERGTDALKAYAVGDTVALQGVEYTVCGIAYNPLLMRRVEEPSFAYGDDSLDRVFYLHTQAPYIVNDARIALEDRGIFKAYSHAYKDEIECLRSETEELLGAENVSVLTLYENASLYSLSAYAEKVGLIGIVFVVFFLLVTLLIVYSATSRLFDEERAQIACLKTLGYGDLAIVGKYVLFVLVGTLVGGLLALPAGIGLTRVIYAAFGIHYRMPVFPQTLNFSYYALTFAIILVSTALLTLASGMKTVREKPVALLARKAPRSGKKVLLERVPFVWNRLSFKYKSTLRNVLLFKSRFLMTVVSVIGSTVLVFAGMGLMDCAIATENAESLVSVSVVLIVFSAALCALVVYNLTNINVSERNREIATLMVLGYHDKEVAGYIFREVYIMCFIGAVLGVPLGLAFVGFVFDLINFGSVAEITVRTYLLTPLATMLFGFLSTRLLRKKIVTTDMNASLKTLE